MPPPRWVVVLCIVSTLLCMLGAVGGLAYADTRLRQWAEDTAEQQVARRMPLAQRVEVTLDGFPFAVDVLLGHEVEGVHVRIDRLHGHGGISASDLRLDVEGIELDGAALLREQRLVVTGIDVAQVEGFVDAHALEEIVGSPIEIDDGSIHALYDGRRIPLYPRVRGAWLELHVEHPYTEHPMVFPLPPRAVLPCEPKVEVGRRRLKLSCRVSQLPDELRPALAHG